MELADSGAIQKRAAGQCSLTVAGHQGDVSRIYNYVRLVRVAVNYSPILFTSFS